MGMMVHYYLGIQKPTVSGVLPYSLGVITYHFLGFGVTGLANSGKCRTPPDCWIEILAGLNP